MKRLLALTGLILAAGALAGAQETAGDRIVVPARNTTTPRIVKARASFGSITVKTHSGKDVIVETDGRSGRRGPEIVEGMKRIDPPARSVEVEEEDNVITVRMRSPSHSDLTITVPPDTSLQLSTQHGAITVQGVRGDVQAESNHGAVRLTGISGTVIANSDNGSLDVSMDRVDPGKPISFTTRNGSIHVTLPDDVKLNVRMSSARGAIYSDFDIQQTGGRPVTEKSDSKDGRFRVRIDSTVYGAINGGGTEASFRTVNGRIMLGKASGERARKER
jgi:hypothetical protein